MTTTARSIRLASRPEGEPTAENFRMEEATLPDPGPGEVAIRVIWLSLDPYMRGRMNDGPSYAEPVAVDDVMTGQTVGEVIASNADGFAQGDIVTGMTGWVSHAIAKADGLRKLDPDQAPVQTALGVLGMPGLTAWKGLDIMEATEGKTVVISAATGAVGSVASQIARARGCRVIGVAGGEEKCTFARETLGCHAAVDHYAQSDGKAMQKAIAEAAPDGVDAYFENVGGVTMAGVVPNMNVHGRIAICGMVAWYNGKNLDQALPTPLLWRTMLTQRLVTEGFIIFDHWHRMDEFVAEVAPMVASGELHYREDVTEGLENAPETFLAMLKGGNFGKTLIKVGDDA